MTARHDLTLSRAGSFPARVLLGALGCTAVRLGEHPPDRFAVFIGRKRFLSMKAGTEPVPASPPATAPRQRSKPLLPIRALTSLLDKNEDQVLRLIEDGKLAFAWDVALDPNRARSKSLRVLPACVTDYMRSRTCSLQWADVLRLILPHDEPEILSRDITRILNCSSTHIYHMARRKLIAPCSTWHRGRGGCARFPVNCFVEFLKKRRYP